MNKKLIGLAIVPIIGLVFIVSTPDPESNPSDNDTKEDSISIPTEPLEIQPSQYSLQECSGSAKCIIGTVTKIIDGSSIHVDDQYVRFALASSPTLKSMEGVESKNFIQTICPVGSKVLVDEDDRQKPEGHSRIIGVVYCNDVILNEELLDANLGYLSSRFCEFSEFASESWAQKHGCDDIFVSGQDASELDSQK